MATESRRETLAMLRRQARIIRQRVMTTLQAAGSGHVGGSLSTVDILTCLYFHAMKVDPKNPRWADRDRFVLSKGHASAALCPTLAEKGFFPRQLLDTFNKLDSPFSMHPDMLKIPGADMSTGSLGHGLSVALGMALAARVQKKSFHTFVLLGDGELAEGSVWEAAMAAAHFKVDTLLAFVDRNRLQVDNFTNVIMGLEPIADKWRAFGWAVREIDGHDVGAILDAIEAFPFESGKPSVIVARTVKGKGLPFAENRIDFHYHDVDEVMAKEAVAILEKEA
ncbi:MAG: transketolase [Chloroflexota bacterium]|nr:transketolase [Chloroflexota bacterium]